MQYIESFLQYEKDELVHKVGMYEGIFKDYYHRMHENTHDYDVDFYKYFCMQAKQYILELCCGDGRITVPLVKEGYSVIGVDNSADQLRELNAQFGDGTKPNLIIYNQDVLDLDIKESFDLVLLPATSISLLANDMNKLYEMFRYIYRKLPKHGKFLFDYRVFAAATPELQTFTIDIKQRKYNVRMQEEINTLRKTSLLNIYLESEDGRERYITSTERRLFAVHEMYRLIDKTGFTILREDNRIFSDYLIVKYVVLEK